MPSPIPPIVHFGLDQIEDADARLSKLSYGIHIQWRGSTNCSL